MISNQIIGNYRLVLFVDHIGIERNGMKIIDNILNQQNINYEVLEKNFEISKSSTNVVLAPISKLELKYSEKEIFSIIQELKRDENVLQIFSWISSKNIKSKILIPFLEHMSELILTITSQEHLSILSKSRSGNVKLREYRHELVTGKTYIKEVKNSKIQQEDIRREEEDIENLGTFKIGQFTAEELEAKRNLKLPFEKIG